MDADGTNNNSNAKEVSNGMALAPPTANEVGSSTSEAKQAQLDLVHEIRRERKKSMILAEGWVEVQERTFLRWVNYQLTKVNTLTPHTTTTPAMERSRPLHKIQSLKDGLSDGVELCALIEVLAKRRLPSKPKVGSTNQSIRLDNLRIAFDFLERHQRGVHLINVRPADVEQGNLKIILGLVWGLIHKYQIMDLSGSQATSGSSSSSSASTGESASSSATATATAQRPSHHAHTSSLVSLPLAKEDSSARSELLQWVNAQIARYQIGEATDFSRSWQDGKILVALVESLGHDDDDRLLDTDVDSSSPPPLPLTGEALTDVGGAIAKAENVYQIPPLMDDTDIVLRPQEHSLMTYIALFREAKLRRQQDRQQQQQQPPSQPSPVEVTDSAQSSAAPPQSELSVPAAEEVISHTPTDPADSATAHSSDASPVAGDEADAALALDGDVDSTPTVEVVPIQVIEVNEADEVGLGAIAEDEIIDINPPATLTTQDAQDGKELDSTPAGDTADPLTDSSSAPQVESMSSFDSFLPPEQRTRSGTHPALVGAFMNVDSLEVAITSPRSMRSSSLTMKSPASHSGRMGDKDGVDGKNTNDAIPMGDLNEEEVKESQPQPDMPPREAPSDGSNVIAPSSGVSDVPSDSQPERDANEPTPVDAFQPTHLSSASASSSSSTIGHDADGPLPDPNAFEDYELDDNAQRPNETHQEAIDRRIEKMMNDIEICIVTPTHKYLQSDTNRVIRAHELNTVTATWTILDGAGGWKFLRDAQSLYLASDPDGRVYMSPKKPQCRWRIILGTTQYFQDMHGRYLATHDGGTTIRTQTEKAPNALFKICFPVVEGVLQKKGQSGLHRWQERYFAFNGNIMSYWRKREAVGKERPAAIYYPEKMVSVNINRAIAKRFNIVFKDGRVVELLAPTVEETVRWVRGLNSRGIRTVQQNRRMTAINHAQLHQQQQQQQDKSQHATATSITNAQLAPTPK